MAVLAASCAPALPSTVPLGRGPLAASTVDAPAPRRASSVPDAAPETTAADAGKADSGEASATASDTGPAEPSGTGGEGGGDAGQEAAAPAKQMFAGNYTGEDVTTFHVGNMPARPQKDPKAKLDVADQGGGMLEFSLRDSRSGKVICKLEGSVSGNTATLRSGQHCFDQQSQGAMTATLDTGTATFTGKQLVFDMHLDLEVNAAGQTLTGDLDYHFEGTRK